MFAVIWHFWIGLALAIGSLGLIISVVVGYIVKVESPRYPKKQ